MVFVNSILVYLVYAIGIFCLKATSMFMHERNYRQIDHNTLFSILDFMSAFAHYYSRNILCDQKTTEAVNSTS